MAGRTETIIGDCAKHGVVTFYARSDGGACGFDEHPAALQFHHLDPGEKAFGLSVSGLTRGIAEMRAEAGKCVLLCANCHAMVEVGARDLPVVDR